jgi:ABC-2 type transport system ATP-binding protein
MNAIETHALTKRYGKLVALDSFDLTVKEGELFSLLGVNGAGKTTAIKLLSCLTRPDAGDALLLGKSAAREPMAIKRFVSVSPQETAVAPNLTVCENLQLMAGICGFNKEKRENAVRELLERFRLDEVKTRRAKTLSGGWQRRLSIAMALISEPRILFLDEPTLGLDVLARSELWDEIRRLRGKVTILLTTHYMEEAEALSDRVGIMQGGHLLAVGTPDEIKEQAGEKSLEKAFISIAKGGAI